MKPAWLLLLLAGCSAVSTLEEHVRFLSSPECEGRLTGTEGERRAAAYIAHEFRRAGIVPVFQEFKGHGTTGRNVIGVVGGASEECVVIGAHYDHLGEMKGRICPGADDNASGTAAILELARRFAARPARRTVVIAAFSGEELGLHGSAFYARNPVIPLEKTVAMINLDMIGRLRETLIVFGTGSGDTFKEHLAGIPAKFGNDPVGPSDHTSFYVKGVPAVHLLTGVHSDWHQPTDTAEKINFAGLRTVTDWTEMLARRIADAPGRVKYQVVSMTAPKILPGAKPYFGSMPDYGHAGKGTRLAAVTPGSPAAEAGMAEGDIIIRINDQEIADVNVYSQVLFSRKPGETITVTYLRGGGERTTKAVLAARKAAD